MFFSRLIIPAERLQYLVISILDLFAVHEFHGNSIAILGKSIQFQKKAYE
jgi:hypothetical protein